MADRPLTGTRTIEGGTYDGTRLHVEFRLQDYARSGVTLPHRYDIEARGGGLGPQVARLRVEVRDGLPRCTRLTVEAPGGVSTASLRHIPVTLLMAEVLPLLAMDRREVSPGHWRSEFLLPPAKARTAAPSDLRETGETGKPGKRLSKDDRLRRFRDVWRQVRAVSPETVPAEVGRRLGYSPTTVYRLRDQAVEAGYLRRDEARRSAAVGDDDRQTGRKAPSRAAKGTSGNRRTTAKGQGK